MLIFGHQLMLQMLRCTQWYSLFHSQLYSFSNQYWPLSNIFSTNKLDEPLECSDLDSFLPFCLPMPLSRSFNTPYYMRWMWSFPVLYNNWSNMFIVVCAATDEEYIFVQHSPFDAVVVDCSRSSDILTFWPAGAISAPDKGHINFALSRCLDKSFSLED